jgi:hypothetical protein
LSKQRSHHLLVSARHITDEQIDARATLEREAVFPRNFGQGSHHERGLLAIDFTERHLCYPIRAVEFAVFHEHAIACAEVNGGPIDPFQPRVLMTAGEEEEKPFHLYASTARQQLLEPLRT